MNQERPRQLVISYGASSSSDAWDCWATHLRREWTHTQLPFPCRSSRLPSPLYGAPVVTSGFALLSLFGVGRGEKSQASTTSIKTAAASPATTASGCRALSVRISASVSGADWRSLTVCGGLCLDLTPAPRRRSRLLRYGRAAAFDARQDAFVLAPHPCLRRASISARMPAFAAVEILRHPCPRDSIRE